MIGTNASFKFTNKITITIGMVLSVVFLKINSRYWGDGKEKYPKKSEGGLR